MSFSKARIQRFNELTSVAPPPGAYDPIKFDRKVKGTAINEKTSRSHDAKSSASSDVECSSVSSRGTSTAPAIKPFRTPQIPKKRVVVKSTGMSCPRVKRKLYKENKDPATQNEPKQKVADLKQECANKDKTIEDYEKLVEHMKDEFSDLSKKYEELQKKYSQSEERYQRDIESMANLQQEVMDNKNEKYQIEMRALKSELASALEEKEKEISERSEVEKVMNAKIMTLEEEISKLTKQDEIIEKMMKLEVASKKLDKMSEEMNEALNLRDLEMADLLKLQSQTENKLDNVQIELKKAEEQVADLKANLGNIKEDISSEGLTMNSRLIEQMITVLQEYFDYDNHDGKWNSENITFHPDVDSFLKNMKKFVTDLKSAYEHEIELSRDNFNEERENLEQELEKEKDMVASLNKKLKEMEETTAFLTDELQDVQKIYKELSCEMKEIKVELEEANERYAQALIVHQTELDNKTIKHTEETAYLYELLDKAKNEYLMELDYVRQMEKKLEEEKKRMKECADKMIENAEAVTRETLKACRAESEEKVRKIITETDSKVNLMVRDAVQASEDKLRQTTEKYEARISNLEKEKAVLNTKVAQKELEITQLTSALEEIKCTIETQESFSQSLQDELDRAEAELVEKKEELRNLKDQLRNESAEMVARRRRFEVVMAENQASFGALADRLAESENEVERLTHELRTKENSLLSYHDLLEKITQNSKLLQEQLDSITDKIDEKVELINHMETKNANDINITTTMFTNEIENLKSTAIQELKRAQKECADKTARNAELLGNLHQMSDRLNEATEMLLKMEEINDEQCIEISKLQLHNTKLKQQLSDKDLTITNNKLSYELQLQEHKTEINKMNDQLTRLKDEMTKLEEKKNEIEEKKYDFEEIKFKYEDQIKSLTEKLASEKTEREKIEKKLQEYEASCERLNEESKQATDKCIEVMDRQRQKQVFQLKDRINVQQIDLLRLRQELDTKTDLVNELRQANDLLKLEARRQLGIGKENVIHHTSSPHKTLFPKSANSTPVSSPHKPLTPLRDRND